MRLALAVATVSALTACQCARVPPYVFPCEADADCLTRGTRCENGYCQAGSAGGGGDAGPGGGAGGGTVQIDAGPSPGYCNRWNCALPAAWQPVDAGITARWFTCPGELSTTVQVRWWGAVLINDHELIAVPYDGSRFARIDLATSSCVSKGAPSDAGARLVGGVLGPDGAVYAFPWSARRLVRYDVSSDEWAEVGPDLGSSPQCAGGTVDLDSRIWTVSSRTGEVFRFDPADGGLTRFAGLDGGGLYGLSRGLERDGGEVMLSFPGPVSGDFSYALVPASGAERVEQVPAPSGVFPTIGCALDFAAGARLVCRAPVSLGLVLNLGASWPYTLAALATSTVGMGPATTGPDGRAWLVPGTSGRLEIPSLGFALDLDAGNLGATPFTSAIATPLGVVAVPGTSAHVLVLSRGDEPRDLQQLLSPYFNRL